jgi:hypothetical protein
MPFAAMELYVPLLIIIQYAVALRDKLVIHSSNVIQQMRVSRKYSCL